MANIEEKYQKVGFDGKKERGEVHSVQGPLRVETNACEADPHSFYIIFSEDSDFEVEELGKVYGELKKGVQQNKK